MNENLDGILAWFRSQDRADWAFYIAGLSFLAAGLSARYTQKLANLEAQKQKRRPPILEMEKSRPMNEYSDGGRKDYPGYFTTDIVIRNVEKDVSVRIVALNGKRNTRFCLREAISEAEYDVQKGEVPLLNTFPDAAFQTRCEISWTLQVAGTPRHQSGIAGDTIYTTLYSKAPLEVGRVKLESEWADGGRS